MTSVDTGQGIPLAIQSHGLRRRFGDKWAVDGVDLAVSQGQIYGFLGPNGAGKSTCVRMLCTLLAPTEGVARVLGYDATTQRRQVRVRVGVALQSAALDDKQTGTELLRLQGRCYGLSRSKIDQRVRELTQLTDLGEAIDDRVGSYSGGMRRRLDLALALVHSPQLLFLDEPTTGLDPVSRIKLWDEIRRLNTDFGVTIFLTTQYLEEADQLAHRVGILSSGRIVAEGTPEELKRSIGNDLIVATVNGSADAGRQALSGLTVVHRADVNGNEISVAVGHGPTAISAVAVALSDARIPVQSLVLRRPTLDDVFISITGRHIEGDHHEEAPGRPVLPSPRQQAGQPDTRQGSRS